MDKLKIVVNHKLGLGANLALIGIGTTLALNALVNVAKFQELNDLKKQGEALKKLAELIGDVKKKESDDTEDIDVDLEEEES